MIVISSNSDSSSQEEALSIGPYSEKIGPKNTGSDELQVA